MCSPGKHELKKQKNLNPHAEGKGKDGKGKDGKGKDGKGKDGKGKGKKGKKGGKDGKGEIPEQLRSSHDAEPDLHHKMQTFEQDADLAKALQEAENEEGVDEHGFPLYDQAAFGGGSGKGSGSERPATTASSPKYTAQASSASVAASVADDRGTVYVDPIQKLNQKLKSRAGKFIFQVFVFDPQEETCISSELCVVESILSLSYSIRIFITYFKSYVHYYSISVGGCEH